MQNFYTATYSAEDSQIQEAKKSLTNSRENFYDKIVANQAIDLTYKSAENTVSSGKDAVDNFFTAIQSHLEENLECYTLEILDVSI